jgi:transglutaminase-like putative cysteine protease
MKLKIYALLTLSFIPSIHALSQASDDNIIITDCSDTYTFIKDADGKTKVKNIQECNYLAYRIGDDIQPYVIYGDGIVLDKASAKGTPQYKNVETSDVFYDGSKMCYFNISLMHKGKTAKVNFERTFTDARMFARYFFNEDYFTKHKQTTIIIPKSMSNYHLKTLNLTPNIIFNATVNDKGDSVFTFNITDMPAFKKENQMPATTLIYPQLLVIGAFADYHDLYKWSAELADVDCTIPNIGNILSEINKGCNNDFDKARRTYTWLQSNIRYVANEAGISGHKPDTPAEVARKQYGDCKGKALLLRTLLRKQGFDARLVYIGTDDIPYRISDVPTLAACNHVICAMIYKGKTYFIDATANYMPIDFIPENLYGRQAMMENGSDCKLITIPKLPTDAAEDSLRYDSEITSDAVLSSNATYSVRGGCKEIVLNMINKADSKDKETILKNLINDDEHNNKVTEAAWVDNKRESEWAKLKGKVNSTSAITSVSSNVYVDMNPHKDVYNSIIDTTKRVNDYCLTIPCKVVRETVLDVPSAKYDVTYMPTDISFKTNQGTLSLSYIHKNDKITMRQVMEISNSRIQRADIPSWNETLKKWNKACNELITLKKK